MTEAKKITKRKHYELRKNPLSRGKLYRIIKVVIEEANDDREKAEGLYDKLLEKVELGTNNANYVEDLRAAIKVLELLTSARQTSVKTLEVLAKVVSSYKAAMDKSGSTSDKEVGNVFDLFDKDDDGFQQIIR